MTPSSSKDRSWAAPTRRSVAILIVVLWLPWLGLGCGSTPHGTSAASSVRVLRAEGRVYRTQTVETLRRIARDRGFDLVVLEALNPRWRGIGIPRGVEIRLPVGKPKIRRISQGSEGTR